MALDGSSPRVLIYDLETAGVNALNSDLSSIVCFGYKWLGEKQAQVLTVDQYPRWFSKNGLNDKGLLKAALKVMAGADLLVAHYGDRFDKPFFHGRCIIHGLTPPPLVKQRDTWRIARDNLKLSSNRLAHLADILGVGEKKYHKECPDEWPGWWLKAMAGNRRAIAQMALYCRQDVNTLEQVYLRLRPYDTAHPRLHDDREFCGICGGAVQYRGFSRTKEFRYRRFQCMRCGHWGRDTKRMPLLA